MHAFDPSAAARPDSGLFGLDTPPDAAAVHVLGVPFDATTSFRRGTSEGPAAILAASHQVDLFDLVTGRPFEAGIHMPPIDENVRAWNEDARSLAESVIEAGGVDHAPELASIAARVDAFSDRIERWVRARTRATLDAKKLPALVGGDHSVPLGAILEVANRHPGLGLFHVDAHADLRPAYEGFAQSHASILHNALERGESIERVLQVGIRDLSEEEHERIADSRGRLHTLTDATWSEARLTGGNLRELVRRELEVLPSEVYVTFDVDGLDPALCPNTGTPVPGGLRWDEAMLWLSELVRSGRRIVGLDLCEVAPDPHSTPGQGWDEIVGARLLYRLIGFALMSQGGAGSR